ncbi:MAG TPA: RNA-binding protein [Thermoanaerobaculia bacterium]|jgi:RNA recognition motif-containing protein
MKLHFGNLATGVSDAQLKELVVPFGEVTTLEIVRDRDGSSKGFGFAELADDHARAAIAGLDGTEIAGQTVKVAEARPRKTAGRN